MSLVEGGEHLVGSAAEACAGGDAVILSLNPADIVRCAVFGPDEIASGANTGTLIIDMSSIDPVSTRALSEDAAKAGLRWLDCPLSGGVPRVATGDLALFAGGL
ncbi:hypothetical protein So717_17790 [Roseobacter cerasinus]|uniref:6-phosphogluconate dehydrogenase NADP-binding domain-containing protein n=2 Tax=Roseobacter cerasinus TaxID=2602289 RepID=A0A640VUW9_9RHOB|nr:hypothetical protein So717_17790 [Roseobacter cerasinus]